MLLLQNKRNVDKITQNKIEIYFSLVILEKIMSVLIHSVGKVCEEIVTHSKSTDSKSDWKYLSKLPMHIPFAQQFNLLEFIFHIVLHVQIYAWSSLFLKLP